VVDEAGAPLPGVTVQVGDQTTVTGDDGTWRFDALPRANALVRFEATGWRPDVRAVWLYREVAVTGVTLEPIALHAEAPGSVRFLFGGDSSFGRRFIDPSGATPLTEVPPDDPTALIQTSDPLPGTEHVLQAMAPLFATADVPVVNLESAVTDDPRTPHPTKDYVYFTRPGSLPGLVDLGVQYVSLGNNHTYDYLEQGVADTMANVTASELGWSGLGRTPEEAWAPYRHTWGGTPYSMVSATSVSGSQHAIGYVATDSQGGAADLRDDAWLQATVGGERAAGRVPIAILHTGQEYTVVPSAYAVDRDHAVIDAGAALVIAHHPHMAQGFGKYAGVPIAYCLGNFVFDQDRLETMTGVLIQAELTGDRVDSVQGIPIQIDDYQPRMSTGPLATSGLRRMAELSDVHVFPYAGRDLVDAPSEGVDRSVNVTVDVPEQGFAIVDLRPLEQPDESLAHVKGDGTVRPGRDILVHGTMEDMDVGGEPMKQPHWDLTASSRFPCVSGAHRGALGLCQTRDYHNTTDSVIAFRNRVRVWGDATDTPNKDLSLFGWVRGEGAGQISVVARYYASNGNALLGQETPVLLDGGTFDWRSFQVDLHMPPDVPGGDRDTNPRAVRLFLHSPPVPNGQSLVAWDDLAVIGWEDTLDARSGADLSTPNARDFLRFEAEPGAHTLELNFRREKPRRGSR